MSAPSVPCVGSQFGDARHVEEYRVLLPFIQAGFERGGRAFDVVDTGLRDPVACPSARCCRHTGAAPLRRIEL